MEQRNDRNYTRPYSYVCILRNKELFSLVCNHYGFRCVSNLGILNRSGNCLMDNGEEKNISQMLDTYPHLFFKPLDTECGEGIFCIDKLSDNDYTWDDKAITYREIENRISNLAGDVLVQTRVIQHQEMQKLYPHSINTLRIVTIVKNGNAKYFSSVLRIGANGQIVDNWAVGGIAVCINTDGSLSNYGFMKPPFGKRMTCHPDTNVQFGTFVVPYFQEAVSLCEKLHEKLCNIWAIGWDVAITPNGPLFIEGNDNWEISLLQLEKGLKKQWDEFRK